MLNSDALALAFMAQGMIVILTGVLGTRISSGDAKVVFCLQALVIALMIPVMIYYITQG